MGFKKISCRNIEEVTHNVSLVPVTHRSRNNGDGRGGRGVACIHKSCSRMDFPLIVYCYETPIFVVTTNWLQVVLYCRENLLLKLGNFHYIET